MVTEELGDVKEDRPLPEAPPLAAAFQHKFVESHCGIQRLVETVDMLGHNDSPIHFLALLPN
jgi:hypothetical protein